MTWVLNRWRWWITLVMLVTLVNLYVRHEANRAEYIAKMNLALHLLERGTSTDREGVPRFQQFIQTNLVNMENRLLLRCLGIIGVWALALIILPNLVQRRSSS
jgi:hypothetical protein